MGKMKFDLCVHLAAFPGVRNSEANPDKYRKNNIDGFRAVLDYCETSNIGRVFFASSSSVYGQISKQSKSKENFANGKNLRSVYAETKWQNELDAKSFFRRTGINCLALRFFTVYGPWGRPDMAYWKFAGALLNSLPISIYGIEGGYRSFSYVTDVVSAIECLTGRSDLPSALNVASDNHVATMHMLQTLCCLLGVKNPIINHVERPAEDVESTHADLSLIKELIEMHNTDLKSGLSKFCDWFIGQSGELSINGIL
jgi:UDP-glucuronate 4-epimerase